jgi:TonB family protein
MRSLIVLAVALCVSGIAFAEIEPLIPKREDWAERPSLADVKAAYPSAAAKAGVEGRATIQCSVAKGGRMSDCTVQGETTPGAGFGDALLSLAGRYRLKATVGAPGKIVMIAYGFDGSDLLDTPPSWVKKPSARDLNAVWPMSAMRNGISGSATISCKTSLTGGLEQCVVREETPAGAGFGQAALLLAPALRWKPGTRDGKPVRSGVSIPIIFSNPTGSRPPAGAAPIKVLPNAPFDRTPSYVDLLAAWPNGAPETMTDGNTAMRCRLRPTGLIDDCDFTFMSSPQFERPSRELAKKFHVTVGPEITAKDIASVYVSVPIQFVSPGRANPARSVTHAVWVLGPQAANYPDEADKQGVKSGRAVTECIVGADGRLTECKVADETPANLGFGPAAVEMASTMKMTLWGEDGLPTAGAAVRLPLQINQPEPQPAAQ